MFKTALHRTFKCELKKLQNFRAGNAGSGMQTFRKKKKKHKSCLQIPKKPSYTKEVYLEGNIFAQYK